MGLIIAVFIANGLGLLLCDAIDQIFKFHNHIIPSWIIIISIAGIIVSTFPPLGRAKENTAITLFIIFVVLLIVGCIGRFFV